MRSGSAQRINNDDFADQPVYRGADRTEKQQRGSTQSGVSQGDSKASSGYKRSAKGKKAEKKRPFSRDFSVFSAVPRPMPRRQPSRRTADAPEAERSERSRMLNRIY